MTEAHVEPSEFFYIPETTFKESVFQPLDQTKKQAMTWCQRSSSRIQQ